MESNKIVKTGKGYPNNRGEDNQKINYTKTTNIEGINVSIVFARLVGDLTQSEIATIMQVNDTL